MRRINAAFRNKVKYGREVEDWKIEAPKKKSRVADFDFDSFCEDKKIENPHRLIIFDRSEKKKIGLSQVELITQILKSDAFVPYKYQDLLKKWRHHWRKVAENKRD